MKRWGFGGLFATHGVSVSHRSLGATGARQVCYIVWALRVIGNGFCRILVKFGKERKWRDIWVLIELQLKIYV